MTKGIKMKGRKIIPTCGIVILNMFAATIVAHIVVQHYTTVVPTN